MKKTIGIIIALLIVVLSLTGCVNIDYSVKVNRNGSGKISYKYGFSKEMMESLQLSAESMVEAQKKQAEKSEYNVEMYEDDSSAGFKANKKVKDLSKEMSMQEVFGEEYVKDAEGNGINIEKNLFTVKYSQTAEVDLTSLSGMEGNVFITYKTSLPVKSKTNNADEVSKDKHELKWNLKAGEVNKIEFTAVGINLVTVIILVVAIVVVICAIIGLLFFLKKKKATK